MKQKSQLTCVKMSIVRLSDKVVSLNLYPFSEKIESHCAKWYSSRQKTNLHTVNCERQCDASESICNLFHRETSIMHLNTSSVLQKQQENLTNEMLTLQKLTVEQNTNYGLQQEARTEKLSYFKRWPHCTKTPQKSTISNQPTHKQQLNENYWCKAPAK